MKHYLSVKAVALASLVAVAACQRGDGYYGYRLSRRGDNESAIYETEGTTSGVAPLNEDPDVYLNASVSVGEISIEVQNITAKINLDARVLNLLNFNAGVDLGIDRVRLGIYNVTARVELEARLGNILRMVDDVLTSIDLNPIIATLGDGVRDIVDEVGDVVDGGNGGSGSDNSTESLSKRDLRFRLENNILYSINDFSGSTHTNRILAQNGALVDVRLNNQGVERRRRQVGYYSRDMIFTGHNRTISENGETVEFELQYLYEPYRGLTAYCNIYVDTSGNVVRTSILAEAEGGGAATIASNSD
ncbi:hypothetical protein S7711_07704 [Stachybotrys chartarum IBT 7711]|uniref:Uncharacterized protein n=1 Tax=Stachybotrys chartarum (strain CBS 109288 / IBT 7711) TaxID=1280523 RepID=A0A084B7X8_STACB|nr:hypothetical protein S7711_07704 [Stachybotrys chartarum IBT 7711]